MAALNFQEELIGIQDYLKSFAMKYTKNEEEAKDLVQETTVKALHYKEKFTPNTNFKAWIFTIMKNIFINQYRRKSKARTIFDHTDNDYFIDIKGKVEKDPSNSMQYKEIDQAIQKLHDSYKKPFLMHFCGYKYKEISDKMQLPIGTVKSRIFLARKKLMDALQDLRYE